MTKKGCLKAFGILLLVAVIATTLLIYFLSEGKPESLPSKKADDTAKAMLKSIGKESFDTTRYFQWTFFRPHHYKWDKKENQAIIEWDDNKVYLQLDQGKGKVLQPTGIDSTKRNEILNTAWSNWCNDSFWIFAPFKVMDQGTTRSLVKDDDGKEGLLIEYSSGGVTPGDSYLWFLDDNNRPTGYKMWTSILPVKGMYASWEGWDEYNGIQLSSFHKLGVMDAELQYIKVGNSLEEMSWKANTFNHTELSLY